MNLLKVFSGDFSPYFKKVSSLGFDDVSSGRYKTFNFEEYLELDNSNKFDWGIKDYVLIFNNGFLLVSKKGLMRGELYMNLIPSNEVFHQLILDDTGNEFVDSILKTLPSLKMFHSLNYSNDNNFSQNKLMLVYDINRKNRSVSIHYDTSKMIMYVEGICF